jgi:hypothetical protein
MTNQTEAIELVLKHAAPSFLSPGWTLVRSEDIKALQKARAEQPAQQGPVTQRAHEMVLRQWEHWKQYALGLQERLVKYEGGAPMVLNAAPQPAQQEPVAWMIWTHGPVLVFMNKDEANLEFDRLNRMYPEPTRMLVPLYKSPPAQRKPLTDERIVAGARLLNQRMAEQCGVDADDQWALYADDFKADARAVLEAAHNIKENP